MSILSKGRSVSGQFRVTPRRVPEAIVGRWSGNFEITAAGLYMMFDTVGFSLSPDGSKFTRHTPKGDETFTRVWGTGSGIEGVWQRSFYDQDTPGVLLQEELHYRADGTHAGHWAGELESLYGRYEVSADTLRATELRGIVEFEGDRMILYPLWGGRRESTYTIEGDVLTITNDEGVKSYRRLPSKG